MKLYHTSRIVLRDPDIHHGRKNADFGPGFYLTPDKEFAYRWAWEGAVINEFELEITDLGVHTFSRDLSWMDYIFQNRRGRDTLDSDIVIGPIANDTIFDTLGIISSGYLKPEEALRLLLIGPEYTQVAVKSEKAAKRLRWIRSEVTESAEKNREEHEEYQRVFAETINAMYP